MNRLELKALVRILGHLGKPWSELPYGLRDLIELDLPCLARAWDQLTLEQHREALRSYVAGRIEDLHFRIGFHEDDGEESRRLREELGLAHNIIEKLCESEVGSMSSDGSPPQSVDLTTVPAGAPQLVIGRGTVLSVPPPYTVQNATGVSVQGTLQVSEPGEPVDITLGGIRRSNMRAVREPTAEQKLASWLRAEGSEYRNASNKDISRAFKKATGIEVGEETIRKARNGLGLSPRKKRSSKMD